VRGTLQGIEVERRGGEQAHRMVGSLKPLQDFTQVRKGSLDQLPLSLFSFRLYSPEQM
jgi:hypothetical protein